MSSTDDALLETYLEYFELSEQQLDAGLLSATSRGELIPVLLASSTSGIGGSALLDAIVRWLPAASVVAPEAFVARLISRHRDRQSIPR